jgi:hypothetical protein
MRTRLIPVVATLLLVSSIAAAPQPAKATKAGFDRSRFEIPHQTFVLDNGLTLISH